MGSLPLQNGQAAPEEGGNPPCKVKPQRGRVLHRHSELHAVCAVLAGEWAEDGYFYIL